MNLLKICFPSLAGFFLFFKITNTGPDPSDEMVSSIYGTSVRYCL